MKKEIEVDDITGEEIVQEHQCNCNHNTELTVDQNIRITALEMYYGWLSDINNTMSEESSPWIPSDAQFQSAVSSMAIFIETGEWHR